MSHMWTSIGQSVKVEWSSIHAYLNDYFNILRSMKMIWLQFMTFTQHPSYIILHLTSPYQTLIYSITHKCMHHIAPHVTMCRVLCSQIGRVIIYELGTTLLCRTVKETIEWIIPKLREQFSYYCTNRAEVQIDGRPRRLSFFPGDKVVRFTGPYGRPSLSVKSLKINDWDH